MPIQPGLPLGAQTMGLLQDPAAFAISQPQEAVLNNIPQGAAPAPAATKLQSEEDDESGKLLVEGSHGNGQVATVAESEKDGDVCYELEDEAMHLLC